MSLKENVNYVKDELNSEEKFLEGFVKTERFYKKNKKIIIAAVVVIVALVVAFYTTNAIKQSNKLEANIAFNQVLQNPKNSEALNILKDKNEQLYQVVQYIQAQKDGKTADIQLKYLKELSDYQKALNANDANKLNSISMQNDFLLKEFAIFNKALIQTNEGKYEEAKATLKLIPKTSKATDLANALNHYLLTK